MVSKPQPDQLLVFRDFACEADVVALLSAFRALVAARPAGDDLTEVRPLPLRTEASCRNVVGVCDRAISNRVISIRARAIATMREFFHVTAYPEFTLMSEMRVGDCHPLHADAERQTAEGWVPNHTPWRSHVGLLYLNTCNADYRGGLLDLPGIGQTIEPVRGLFVAFPSGRRHVHKVTPVEAGRRLSMAIWLTGDAARAEHLG